MLCGFMVGWLGQKGCVYVVGWRLQKYSYCMDYRCCGVQYSYKSVADDGIGDVESQKGPTAHEVMPGLPLFTLSNYRVGRKSSPCPCGRERQPSVMFVN
ncbi:unknown [Prevotella sp. CAG:924]|nr:unknown [Prevotella sp. CAG:924]